jgi:DNA topoisomerase IA
VSSNIVITEKSSQARDVRAALGNRYGPVLPAEGHLVTLREPEEANPSERAVSDLGFSAVGTVADAVVAVKAAFVVLQGQSCVRQPNPR